MLRSDGPNDRCLKGILQKPRSFEKHENSAQKVKWDEHQLEENRKGKEQNAFIRIDEPKTPYIVYDSSIDKVFNWEGVPQDVRLANEPDLFKLDSHVGPFVSSSSKESEEWDKIDEKEEALRKRREEFEKKRALHYFKEYDDTKR